MASTTPIPQALIVSGDRRTDELLHEEGAVVIPAFSCRFDGFVNDTFTEYANASIYRTASVREARLVSKVQDTVNEAGRRYFGFTMYCTAGCEESVEMWIGHRQVAHAAIPEPDNRVHLFVAPEPFRFRGGETVRLVTGATGGAYRIENLVLLPRRPRPTAERLEIRHPHVDVRFVEGGALRAFVSWTTNRPAKGVLRWGKGGRFSHGTELATPLANHEICLDGLEPDKSYAYRIELQDPSGRLSAAHEGTFRTSLPRPRGRRKQERVPVLLRRPAQCSLPWPVSVGIPFPEGAAGSDGEMRLLDRWGNEVPMQARTLAEWPDGSVKWALLDFQAERQEEVVLECGNRVARTPPGNPLQAVEERSGITVTTGPIRVELPRNRLVLPGIVSLRLENGGYRRVTPKSPSPAVSLVDADGRLYEAKRPDAVILEESGPERACVRIEARHRSAGGESLFRSIFRIHLFRDSSALRVLHTFENDNTASTFTHIRQMCLRADIGLDHSGKASLGNLHGLPLGRQPLILRQTHDNRYRIQHGQAVLAGGRRSEGVVEVSGDMAAVSLVVRSFWQNYPKGLQIDRNGVAVEICPPLLPNAYPKGNELEDRLYYYLLDGVHKLKQGVARTHELWFHFRPPGDAAPNGFKETVQSPPLYSVSLTTFNRSRAVTCLPSKEKSPYPAYEAWVEAARDAYRKDRELWRSYGMLNFGDWFGERWYNWGNQEYDAAWCFLQEYLRNGHPDFYTWAEEAAGHLVDVDTCHYSSNPKNVGSQYAHCVGHVGDYYPDGYREKAIFGPHFTVCHFWVEGPFLYHLLSGDMRSLECAMKTVNQLAGSALSHYDFTNCRNCGWALIHLSAAYKTTGRRIYLNAARIIVERVLERQRPSGGWERLMVPGHCYCLPPRHTGNAGFMVGVLMVGLKRYYEATGDRRVAEAIVRAADYCIDSMWVPEKRVFRYTSCPKSALGGGADMRILKGVAFAWRYSRRKRFRDVLLDGIQTAISGRFPAPHRGTGKSICSPMRGAPQVLIDLPRPRR